MARPAGKITHAAVVHTSTGQKQGRYIIKHSEIGKHPIHATVSRAGIERNGKRFIIRRDKSGQVWVPPPLARLQ